MDLALRGIVIGLSLGAPIGPINVEIVRRGLRSGFLSGWLVGIGAITGDTMYCLMVIAGIAPLVDHQIVRTVLWSAGGGFLIYLGYHSLRAAVRDRQMMKVDVGRVEQRSYLTGLLMALFNPMGIVFWLSIGGAVVASTVEQAHSDAGTVSVVIGVIAGLSLWITILSALTRVGRRFVTDRLFRLINVASGLILLGFGAWFAVQTVSAIV
jgi:L-lysine exporter family protein LysE/ArgO